MAAWSRGCDQRGVDLARGGVASGPKLPIRAPGLSKRNFLIRSARAPAAKLLVAFGGRTGPAQAQ